MPSPVRVTTDAEVFEYSGDSHQLFSPGGAVFGEASRTLGTELAGDGEGVCWLLEPEGEGRPKFVVLSRFGMREVRSLEELCHVLDQVGEPGRLPSADCEGYRVALVT